MSQGTVKQKVIVRRSFDGRHDVQWDIKLNFRNHREKKAVNIKCDDEIASKLTLLKETFLMTRDGDGWIIVFNLDLDPLEVLREHFEVELVEM